MDIVELGTSDKQAGILLITSDIVTAYLGKNPLPVADVPNLIASVYTAVAGAVDGAIKQTLPDQPKPTPAEIKRSITPEALISFIDGKAYKTLKRHITKHGLDFDGYRQRFGLPADYPSTAPSYSEQRAALARAAGLGRRPAPAEMQAAA